MSILVVKFGGTSVATPERILNAASKVRDEIARGHKVAVVVSAMAGQTNALVDLSNSFGETADQAERDVIIASGEQVSAGMMALALQSLGVKARSWQGWQARILCDDLFGRARIRGIESDALLDALGEGEVPVITGFQGVSSDGRMVTLGRGGSDTSAVAMASALKAARCDIYTDVDGVYTADPRLVPQARKIDQIDHETMLEMASLGSKVLQTRSVELAMKEGVELQVLSSLGAAIGSDLTGTLLVKEPSMEQETVTGIAHSVSETKITLIAVPDQPGIAAKLFGALAARDVNVDMIVQNVSAGGNTTDVTFTIARDQAQLVQGILQSDAVFGTCEMRLDDDIAKISIVGVGVRSYAGIAARAFAALAEADVNLRTITTSETRLSILVRAKEVEKAVQILHNAFKLDQD